MRIIGLDLGTKTLGVSVSDSTMSIATGLEIIRFNENESDKSLPRLKEIIDEYNAELLVLGLPLNMNNTVGTAASRSIEFKKVLEENFKVKVEFQDERLSSVTANNVLLKADVSRKKRKQKVDSIAATIILQNYLDIKKGKEKYGK